MISENNEEKDEVVHTRIGAVTVVHSHNVITSQKTHTQPQPLSEEGKREGKGGQRKEGEEGDEQEEEQDGPEEEQEDKEGEDKLIDLSCFDEKTTDFDFNHSRIKDLSQLTFNSLFPLLQVSLSLSLSLSLCLFLYSTLLYSTFSLSLSLLYSTLLSRLTE
jgi:outer membrane protein OmpA-like peptidoglycan-associated protein